MQAGNWRNPCCQGGKLDCMSQLLMAVPPSQEAHPPRGRQRMGLAAPTLAWLGVGAWVHSSQGSSIKGKKHPLIFGSASMHCFFFHCNVVTNADACDGSPSPSPPQRFLPLLP